MLFQRMHQPQVVGEMLAGIMLGPSLFGWASRAAVAAGWTHTNWAAAFFPATSIPYLGILSQVGVIFFLFLVGLELDPKLLRNRGHAAVVISHVSIVAPFLLGAILTLYLYPRLFNDAPNMGFTPVALFMGAAMSITAFPVLARILTERNLHKTNVGAVSITCAAVDDVTAWCMLAFVVGVARAEGFGPAMRTAAFSAAYVLFMFFVLKPFLARLQKVYDRQGRLSQNVFALIVLLTLLSAWTTEQIGIHALFGAFLMGAIMPKGTGFVRTVSERLEDYTVVFLLPIFFAYTGLRTQIGLLSSGELWGYTLLIILVACLGKFGGSTLAGRACGLSWRESSTVGILMNTRGLMELVILNIGRELGVITAAVFAMMVLMALVTTGLTTPVLQLVYPRRLYDPDFAPRPEGTKPRRRAAGFSILIPVADPRSGGPLLRLAELIAGSGAGGNGRKIYALHLSRPTDRDAYRAGMEGPRRSEAPAEGGEAEASLRPLLEHAQRHHLPVEAISYVTRDVAEGVARVADEREVDLILMGFHRPVLGKTLLGGTVHRVLTSAAADVGVFVDRGFLGARRVLVPYLGTRQDRLALEVAARIGRNALAEVTVLHVVPPDRQEGEGAGAAKLDADGAVTKVFDDPSQPAPVNVKVVPDESPVDAVLRESAGFDLIVVGLGEEWGLESHRFGLRPERIAEGSSCSLLLVRRREGGPSDPPAAPESREASPRPPQSTPQPVPSAV
jgi:Kef-type K+ transport system membrane component KefB/nucleotide-binding universal stress UspA family protein